MKDTLSDEELNNELQNNELDNKIQQYLKSQTDGDFVELAKAIYKEGILTVGNIVFIDKEEEQKLMLTGHLDMDAITDPKKTQINQLIVELNDKKWFPIFTNKIHIKDYIFEDYNTILSTTFNDAYEEFKNCPFKLEGIVINPYTDHIFIKPELCYYIASGCDNKVLDILFEMVKRKQN